MEMEKMQSLYLFYFTYIGCEIITFVCIFVSIRLIVRIGTLIDVQLQHIHRDWNDAPKNISYNN